MSKRTLRRAAEREARKLARVQNPAQANPQPTFQAPAEPNPFPPVPKSQDFFASDGAKAAKLDLSDDLCQRAELLNWETDLTASSGNKPGTNLDEDRHIQAPATAAQIAANQANAQLSTGPVTAEGKAIVSQNRRSHGLTGVFHLLPHERRQDLDLLKQSVYAEYQPATGTEQRLADDMIQHYWLAQRALFFQQQIMYSAEDPINVDDKLLSLYMRYHAMHERSYYKALRELQNLQKQKSRHEIGFESQKVKVEAIEAKTRLTQARARNIELDIAVRQVMEAPLPGTTNIPFDELAAACSTAIARVAYKHQSNAAA